jgi:hypothetical protein
MAMALVFGLFRRRKRRRLEAQTVALDLVPEVRAMIASCDSGGEPIAADQYILARHRLPKLLSEEPLFAVETFYQCVEAYRIARAEMIEAFAEASTLRLGDRIRAKDRRDRCLKDVLYTGEAAMQALSRMAP